MRIAKGQPTPSDVHVDRPLTDISVLYMQEASDFVATKVFPIVHVKKQTDKYFIHTKNDWFRDEVKRRAPSTQSAGTGYNLSTATYSCDVWGLHKDIDQQTYKNYDNPLRPEQNATDFLTQMMLIRMEVQWAADFFVTSIWGTTGTPTITWNDATSDPRTDIDLAKRAIRRTTGHKANKLTLGYDVFNALKRHPDLRDQFKYTSDQVLTPSLLARLFDVEEVLVLEAVKATNAEGATEAYSFVCDSRSALLTYSPKAPAIEMPSCGYIFMWDNDDSPSMGAGPWGVTKWWMQEIKSNRVEIEAAWDNKLVGSDLGYFWLNAVAEVDETP